MNRRSSFAGSRALAGLVALVLTIEWSRGTGGALWWRALASAALVSCLPNGLRALVVALPVFLSSEPVGWGFVIGPFMYVPFFVVLRRGAVTDALTAAVALTLTQTVVLSAWVWPALPAPAATEWLVVGIIGALWLAATRLTQRQLHAARPAARWAACLFIPAMEWLRTETPGLRLPSHLTAHAVAQNLWLAQLVEPLGILGLSIFGTTTSLLMAASFAPGRQRGVWTPRRAPLLGTAALFLIAGIFAAVRLHAPPDRATRSVMVRVVQEFDGPDRSTTDARLRFADAVQRAVAKRDADVIALPENALSASILPGSSLIAPTVADVYGFLRESQSEAVVIGGVADGTPEHSKVSAWTIQAGRPPQMRDKLILAPIGESPPFAGWPGLDGVGRWITRDRSRIIFADARAEMPLLPSLEAHLCFCFESLIPGIWAQRGASTPADLQLCLADVSYFDYSPLERAQHRAARRLRAIELRTPFLYVANGGSELFDAFGRLVTAASAETETVRWAITLPDERSTWPLSIALARAKDGPYIFGIILLLACGFAGPPRPHITAS